MPRVKRTKRVGSSKRKATKRKTRTRAFVRRTPLTGVGKVHYARLRYCEESSATIGAGTTASNVYKANGLYDPRSGAGGHQPAGFDQMMTYYKKFIVLGSKITVRFTPVATSNLNMCYAGILVSNTGTDVGNFGTVETLLESKNGSARPALFGGYFDSQNRGRATISKSWGLKKWIGSRPGSEDVYAGDASADPASTVYYETYFSSVAGNDPGDMYFLVTIDYFVKFFEPKNIAAS